MEKGIYSALIEAIKEIRQVGVSVSGDLPIGGKSLPYRTIGDALNKIPDILLKHGISWSCRKRNTDHFQTETVDKYGKEKQVHTWVTTIDYSLIYIDGSQIEYSFDGQGESFTKGVLTAQTTALRNFLLTVCGIPSGDLDEIQSTEKEYHDNNKPSGQNKTYSQTNQNNQSQQTSSDKHFMNRSPSWDIYWRYKEESQSLDNNTARMNLWITKYEQEWKSIPNKIEKASEAIQGLLNKFAISQARSA